MMSAQWARHAERLMIRRVSAKQGQQRQLFSDAPKSVFLLEKMPFRAICGPDARLNPRNRLKTLTSLLFYPLTVTDLTDSIPERHPLKNKPLIEAMLELRWDLVE